MLEGQKLMFIFYDVSDKQKWWAFVLFETIIGHS